MTPTDVPGSRLLACLGDDVDRLTRLAAGNLTIAVPACPGWDVGQLMRHLAHGLVNVALRRLRMPDPPPEHDLAAEEPIAALRCCHTAFVDEVATYGPGGPAGATARFWLRRMTYETAVHRVDVERAIGLPVGPIEPDLAVDGVAEALSVFLYQETHSWREEYQSDLTEWGDRSLLVVAGTAGWRVAVRPEGVEVGSADAGDADAVVRGEPVAVLLWLYDRGDDVLVEGDRALVAQVRRLLGTAMG
ncbi:MAG TPA: maleylpyruvate isomerase family mycothiol-dependent enzyme [Pseudonocardiaceae bacterium]|nr:maleylpyruvate isomerase family mycothiol-dependent enzyme [Pseudonocardiaceae bacterium]